MHASVACLPAYLDLPVFREEDVERLDVSMDNVILVEIVDCSNEILRELPHFLLAEQLLSLAAVP